MTRILVIFLLSIFTPGCLPSVHAQESPPTSKADPDKAASSQFKRLTADELRAELPGNTFYNTYGWHFYVAPEGGLYTKSNQNSSINGRWSISDDGEFCTEWHHWDARLRCEKWGQRGELFEADWRERCLKIVLRRVKGNPEDLRPVSTVPRGYEAPPQPAPPLPRDISIQAPSPDIPEQIASLLGKWEGDWVGKLNSFLIVEKVDLEKATVVYGWGNYPPWEVYARGYTRRFAKILTSEEGSRLELSIRNGKYSFQLSKDRKTLYGRYTNAIELKKTGAPVPQARASSYLPPKAKTVGFENVNVIPMDKEHVIPSQTVIVEDGRIAQIGTMDQVTIPKSAEIVRGEGKAFLMPGLADMHVHIDLLSQ